MTPYEQSNNEKMLAGEERRHIATKLYLQGMPQHQIGKQLGVTQQQISVDIKAMQAEWLRERLKNWDAIQAKELAKIDLCEAEAWAGWQRSCQDKEITLTKAVEGHGKPSRAASVRKEGQAGNPVFIQCVLNCVERRCKLLGLDAPVKFTIDWDMLTDKQLARLVEGDDPGRVLAEA